MIPRTLIGTGILIIFLSLYYLQRKKILFLNSLLKNGSLTKDGKIIVDGKKIDGIFPGIDFNTIALLKKRKKENENKKL